MDKEHKLVEGWTPHPAPLTHRMESDELLVLAATFFRLSMNGILGQYLNSHACRRALPQLIPLFAACWWPTTAIPCDWELSEGCQQTGIRLAVPLPSNESALIMESS